MKWQQKKDYYFCILHTLVQQFDLIFIFSLWNNALSKRTGISFSPVMDPNNSTKVTTPQVGTGWLYKSSFCMLFHLYPSQSNIT